MFKTLLISGLWTKLLTLLVFWLASEIARCLTGASDMLINSEIESYLSEKGILTPSNFRESKVYEIANGEKIEMRTAILSSIKIDGYQFNNIKIIIGDQNSSLLLGMSFLNRYKWYFDKNTLVLETK